MADYEDEDSNGPDPDDVTPEKLRELMTKESTLYFRHQKKNSAENMYDNNGKNNNTNFRLYDKSKPPNKKLAPIPGSKPSDLPNSDDSDTIPSLPLQSQATTVTVKSNNDANKNNASKASNPNPNFNSNNEKNQSNDSNNKQQLNDKNLQMEEDDEDSRDNRDSVTTIDSVPTNIAGLREASFRKIETGNAPVKTAPKSLLSSQVEAIRAPNKRPNFNATDSGNNAQRVNKLKDRMKKAQQEEEDDDDNTKNQKNNKKIPALQTANNLKATSKVIEKSQQFKDPKGNLVITQLPYDKKTHFKCKLYIEISEEEKETLVVHFNRVLTCEDFINFVKDEWSLGALKSQKVQLFIADEDGDLNDDFPPPQLTTLLANLGSDAFYLKIDNADSKIRESIAVDSRNFRASIQAQDIDINDLSPEVNDERESNDNQNKAPQLNENENNVKKQNNENNHNNNGIINNDNNKNASNVNHKTHKSAENNNHVAKNDKANTNNVTKNDKPNSNNVKKNDKAVNNIAKNNNKPTTNNNTNNANDQYLESTSSATTRNGNSCCVML